MDLIKIEIEQLKQQIEVLDAIFDDYSSKKQVSYCETLKISIKDYYGSAHLWYESLLHKLGYCKRKEEINFLLTAETRTLQDGKRQVERKCPIIFLVR